MCVELFHESSAVNEKCIIHVAQDQVHKEAKIFSIDQSGTEVIKSIIINSNAFRREATLLYIINTN
jgi:hypothetical protein